MSDIFICYSRQDLDIAEKLMQRMQAEGWTVFIDKQTHVGRRWHQEIEKELHASKAVVVLWSSSSRDSDFVLEEAEYGKRNDILFPAFIEQVNPPYGFSRIQTADLTDWINGADNSGLTGLLNALRLHLNESISEVGPTENTSPVQSIPETANSVESNATKRTPSEETTANGSPRKKFFFISLLMLFGFASFPIVEWFYEKALSPPPIDELAAELEASHDSDSDYPENELLAAPVEDETNEPPNVAIQTDECGFPDNQNLPTMVAIPTGSFYFDHYGKQVEISAPFCLSKYEITYAQYDFYTQEQQHHGHEVKKPETAKGGRGSQPVVNVNHHDAAAYTAWLGEKTGHECRLPTEVEWEYAARAGTDTAYYWGDDVGVNNANCNDCGSRWDGQQAAPVGQFTANPFGLHDMLGNVWEWTCSFWDNVPGKSAQECPTTDSNEFRVLRGGSWYDNPVRLRASGRLDYHPGFRNGFIGFRVLCSSPIE